MLAQPMGSLVQRREDPTATGELTFSCQATELRAATSGLHWWDVRQYAHDLKSRNVSPVGSRAAFS